MHVAIIGNGVTGITAALELRAQSPDCRITVISGESTFHYSRPALMYVFMGHMTYRDTKPFEDHVWAEQRIELKRDWVTGIDVEHKQLQLHRGPPLSWDKLLLATGSRSNKFGWPGQDLPGVQGLYGLMDLRSLYENTARCEHAVIVGGGLIGIELAEMLHSRGIGVTFLVRERSYWGNVLPAEESAVVKELIAEHGLGLRLDTELAAIHPGPDGRVQSVTTSAGDHIECQLVGLTAGVSPNLDVICGTPIETARGVLVDDRLRTTVPDVYAAGDCAEIRSSDGGRNLLQQVWYTGKKQGAHVARTMLGEDAPYDPGIWFNSAKFLQVEFQTYGWVVPAVATAGSLFWRHPHAKVALRIAHRDGTVVGFNTLGMRYRHEVCERWIQQGARVRDVLPRLRDAAFDPEFFARHETAIAKSFQQQLTS